MRSLSTNYYYEPAIYLSEVIFVNYTDLDKIRYFIISVILKTEIAKL